MKERVSLVERESLELKHEIRIPEETREILVTETQRGD